MKYLVRFSFLFIAAAMLFACGGKNVKNVDAEEITDPREDQHMQRSQVDTLGILYLVNDYLTKLKDNNIDSAMALLYEASGDTVLPISDTKKAEVLQMVKNFPVLKYNIDQILMYSEQDTEVRYTIEFFEKTADDPRPNTLQCVINPRRVGYYWYLTIPDRKVETNYSEEENMRKKMEEERERNEREEEQ